MSEPTGGEQVPPASEATEAKKELEERAPTEEAKEALTGAEPIKGEPPAPEPEADDTKSQDKVEGEEPGKSGNEAPTPPVTSPADTGAPVVAESGDEEAGEIKAGNEKNEPDKAATGAAEEGEKTSTPVVSKVEEAKTNEEEAGLKSVESCELVEKEVEKEDVKVVKGEAPRDEGKAEKGAAVKMEVDAKDAEVAKENEKQDIAMEVEQPERVVEEKQDGDFATKEEKLEKVNIDEQPESDVPPTEEMKESPIEEETTDAVMEEAKEEVAAAVNRDEKALPAVPPLSEPQSEGAESSSKAELPYSTRGRATGVDVGSVGDLWERSSRDGFDDIGRAEKPSATTLGTSFLESLSEEERRTRTRFLPDVDGMHTLRKHEVKGDLALARSIASGSGVTSLGPSKKNKPGKRGRVDDDGMEVEEDEDTTPSEDDRSSELGTTTFEIGKRDLTLPSNAFIPPPGDASDLRDGQRRGELLSPLIVEAVTAFDPPRPAESVWAKKKHRMLRWERRPEDLEVDLSNYRKTVQRTRQELHKAEAECERLETIDSHLRRHLLGHLDSLNEEYFRLNDELGRVQQECVSAADLLTSRTRSRGAGKGTYVMRDVLSVLKARGAEMKEKGIAMEPPASEDPSRPGGLGGLSSFSFEDWVGSSVVSPKKLASSWLLSGDKVQTPYGKGTVLDVYSFSKLSDAFSPIDTSVNPLAQTAAQRAAKPKDADKSSSKKKKEDLIANTSAAFSQVDGKVATRESDTNPTIPPRVSVKLQFGVGYFPIGSVNPIEDVSSYSDGEFASRWQKMFATASKVGTCLDVEGMAFVSESSSGLISDSDEGKNEESTAMDVDDDAAKQSEAPEADQSSKGSEAVKSASRRFLPFGAGLLPTSSGRGSYLQDLSVINIEKEIHTALFDAEGVLGDVSSADSVCESTCVMQNLY